MANSTWTFDDFEDWFLCGATRNKRVTATDRRQLLENIYYLADVEQCNPTQSREELTELIADWAKQWNEKIS